MSESGDVKGISRYYALAWLGISSLTTVVAGIASSKIAAEIIGVPGVGLMALVLTCASLLSTLIMFGSGQTIVREVGRAEALKDTETVRDVVTSARVLVLALSVVAAVLSAVVGPFISAPIFGEGALAWWPFGVALASGAYAWGQLQISTLIAFHRIKLVSVAAVSTAFVSPAINYVAFNRLGIRGVVPGAIVANVLVALVLTLLTLGTASYFGDRIRNSIRSLPLITREGLSLVPVSLLGTAAMFGAFFGVRVVTSINEVGQARAAMTIALSYIVAVNAATTRDYFPRLSRVVDQPRAFAALTDQQIRLVLLIAGPMIAALVAVLPFVVRIMFSAEFLPAVQVLRWQVIGDLLRLVSVVLATTVLVGLGPRKRLMPEAIGSAAFLTFTVCGAWLAGLTGFGIGYALNYVLYLLLLVWSARSIYVPERSTVSLLAFFLSMLLVSALADFLVGGAVASAVKWAVAVVLTIYAAKSILTTDANTRAFFRLAPGRR